MFTGEHTQKMDTKGRTIVPVKFREELGNNVVITRGLDGCLFAYSKTAWEALEEKLSSLPFADKKVRSFNRFFLAGASDLETDKLGRILMPSVLRKFASLDKEVVWVGVGDRIEIWDIDKWNEQMASYLEGDDVEEQLDDLAAYMAEKGI
ncbi:MAG: division/cell wall cluster transcriptional repressor MraZ [Eubacterium sp.]